MKKLAVILAMLTSQLAQAETLPDPDKIVGYERTVECSSSSPQVSKLKLRLRQDLYRMEAASIIEMNESELVREQQIATKALGLDGKYIFNNQLNREMKSGDFLRIELSLEYNVRSESRSNGILAITRFKEQSPQTLLSKVECRVLTHKDIRIKDIFPNLH